MKKYKFFTINNKGINETFEKEMQSHEVQTYINWLYNTMEIKKLLSQEG